MSVLKFIEDNWRLSQLSAVSEDNLPNATPGAYVPRNSPAIGNLMTLFDFGHPDFAILNLPAAAQAGQATAADPVISNAQR